MTALRVLFLHGQESGPGGTKAQLLAAAFDCTTPAMPTDDFEACVRLQADALTRFRPDVLVGSSFGGAVGLALLQRGLWSGPTLLLAPAVRYAGLEPRLPPDVPVWIVHATADVVVPVDQSRELARGGRAGAVRFFELDDDHRLGALVSSGRLVALVRELGNIARSTAPLRAVPEGTPATETQQTSLGRHISVFLEDTALWPILVVLVAHVSLAGGLLLLGALRQRSPVWIGVLGLAAIVSGDLVWRARRRGRAAAWAAAIWGLSVLWAVAGNRLGLL